MICAMMAHMKKLVFLLFFVMFLAPAHVPVRAESLRYAVAADSNVWFYASEDESDKLFLVPETYYVRILSEGEVFTAVEYLVNEPPYKKVLGYCRTAALTFVDFIPARPYLKRQVVVSYKLPDAGGMEDTFGSIEKKFVYYGMRYENGQLYFYVLSDGVFGYIPAEEPLVFEKNDDWLTAETPPVSGETDAPMSEDGVSAIQIVVICLVLAAAIAVALFVIKGRKPPRGDDASDP